VASAAEQPAPDKSEPAAPEPEPEPSETPPRKPERFRPAAQRTDDADATAELPPATSGRPHDIRHIPAPPRELPLSYLMKFRNMTDFHAFLDTLPSPARDDNRTMSLIRIEGLPQTEPDMRRLFQSYRMEPFLFNPDRFNYLITADGRLLRDPASIGSHIARLGRYLREDRPNAACSAIRNDAVERARRSSAIRDAITDPAEFDRMQLGLGSAHLARFFRKLEDDTARQLTELTGRSVAVEDIARIDCRFRDVNGAMVLVPWSACLGTGAGREPVRIWRE
jgi:hypothetical protein